VVRESSGGDSGAAMPKEPPEDLWAKITTDLESGTLKTQTAPVETYSLFTGQHGSGKSSLMALLQGGGTSGKDDKPKPTVALEYMFARKSTNGAKDVAHIWELGGGMNLQQLVGVPITPARLPFAVLGIVIDLSEPSNALPSLAHWIRVLRTHVNRSLDALPEDEQAAILEASRSRFKEDHPDRLKVEPFPVPLLILANKYDLFKNNESMKKKVMCQALRFVAHAHGASLLFVSTREKGLQNSFRSLITQHLFRKSEGKQTQATELSAEKPLSVPAGADTFDAILKNLPQGTRVNDFLDGKSVHKGSLQTWAKSVEEFFGPASETFEAEDAETEDGSEVMRNDFPEPKVDEMHQARMEALARYRSEAERRLKIEEKSKRAKKP